MHSSGCCPAAAVVAAAENVEMMWANIEYINKAVEERRWIKCVLHKHTHTFKIHTFIDLTQKSSQTILTTSVYIKHKSYLYVLILQNI